MEIEETFQNLDFKPKKYLGQNFLMDKKVLEKIVEAADLKKEDVVLEVGPGTGLLTEKLAERAGLVLAVEKDRRLADFLKRKFSNRKNVRIIIGDILKKNLLQATSYKLQASYKVVANIPYYITSRFLRVFLERKNKPKVIVILVQKEVAQRICAKKGEHSLLSLSCQYYGKPAILDFVSKNSFYPKPKVDSAILKIEVYKNPPYKVSDEKLFFDLIRAVFQSRRKQLHNSLSKYLKISKNEVKNLLKRSQILPQARPQDLGLDNFKSLYSFIHTKILRK